MRGESLVRVGALVLVACSTASSADPPFWRPSYSTSAGTECPPADSTETPPEGDPGAPVDASDAGASNPVGQGDGGKPGGGNSGPTPDAGTVITAPCSLGVTVTTAAVGGKYAPDNIAAIWVADAQGAFVKTLDVWADRRIEHLEQWGAVTTAAGVPGNTVDAITGATKLSHGTRTAKWDCTDYQRHVAPDGAYRVCFELTDSNDPGPVDCVDFAKGASPAKVSPVDTATFKSRAIVFTP